MWTALCSLDNLQFDHNKRQVKSCIFCTQNITLTIIQGVRKKIEKYKWITKLASVVEYSSFWNHKAKSYGIKTTSYAHKTTNYAFKIYTSDN